MKNNIFVNFKNDAANNKFFSVTLKSISIKDKLYNEEKFVYFNPHKETLAQIHRTKKDIKDVKDNYTPLIRYFLL
jgi:hypothetical protein